MTLSSLKIKSITDPVLGITDWEMNKTRSLGFLKTMQITPIRYRKERKTQVSKSSSSQLSCHFIDWFCIL